MSEPACERVSWKMPSLPCLALYLLTPRFSVYLYSICKRFFFLPVPYFLLLSVNIAMMILNFFTRLHTYRSHRTQRLLKTVHIHIKRKKKENISPLPQQGRINWLVSLLTTITKKTNFKKDFLKIMMLYVQWSSVTLLRNYWRFPNEIMWIESWLVFLFHRQGPR